MRGFVLAGRPDLPRARTTRGPAPSATRDAPAATSCCADDAGACSTQLERVATGRRALAAAVRRAARSRRCAPGRRRSAAADSARQGLFDAGARALDALQTRPATGRAAARRTASTPPAPRVVLLTRRSASRRSCSLAVVAGRAVAAAPVVDPLARSAGEVRAGRRRRLRPPGRPAPGRARSRAWPPTSRPCARGSSPSSTQVASEPSALSRSRPRARALQRRARAVRLRRLPRPPGAAAQGRQLLPAAPAPLRGPARRAGRPVHRLRRRRRQAHAGRSSTTCWRSPGSGARTASFVAGRPATLRRRRPLRPARPPIEEAGATVEVGAAARRSRATRVAARRRCSRT